METPWMNDGSCRNHPPDVFFPSDGVGVTVAQRICGSCPVRRTCLEYALENRIDHGVWGGTSERERRRILKRRRVPDTITAGS
jgi:WhiB family transcriptional regulator, redox-sensing transcriptional regulator